MARSRACRMSGYTRFATRRSTHYCCRRTSSVWLATCASLPQTPGRRCYLSTPLPPPSTPASFLQQWTALSA
eukprot:scaffold1428_cov64-Phaeocystis_antarctica.AAC.5